MGAGGIRETASVSLSLEALNNSTLVQAFRVTEVTLPDHISLKIRAVAAGSRIPLKTGRALLPKRTPPIAGKKG